MENIMTKIIMGPTLFLCLLFLIMNETSLHQCSANAIAIDNSSSVALNEAIVNGTGNNSDTLFLDGQHSSTPASNVTLVEGNVSLPNSSSNTTEVTAAVIVEEDLSKGKHKKPCPVPNPSQHRKDHGDNNESEHKKNELGMQGNGTDSANSTTVKDEKHETALQHLGESISGVINNFKKSFTSIFSPGSGLPAQGRDEYEDCYTNDSFAGGEGSTNSSSSNMTLPSHEAKENQGDLEGMSKKEGEKILIHPVSNNDTVINGGIMSNSTNATNTNNTSSPLMMTTVLPEETISNMTTPVPTEA